MEEKPLGSAPFVTKGLTIACLAFCLLLTDRPILGVPEYKLKLSILVKCTEQRVVKLWCLTGFSDM